jgi:hypothetical protein
VENNGRNEDVIVEAQWFVELGNALNVAGDRCIGAASRLRAARSEDEREHIRAELRGFLRRTISGATIAFAVLGESGVTKGTP